MFLDEVFIYPLCFAGASVLELHKVLLVLRLVSLPCASPQDPVRPGDCGTTLLQERRVPLSWFMSMVSCLQGMPRRVSPIQFPAIHMTRVRKFLDNRRGRRVRNGTIKPPLIILTWLPKFQPLRSKTHLVLRYCWIDKTYYGSNERHICAAFSQMHWG